MVFLNLHNLVYVDLCSIDTTSCRTFDIILRTSKARQRYGFHMSERHPVERYTQQDRGRDETLYKRK